MSDNPLMLKDLLEILLRRKWYFALPAGAILFLSVALAFLLPAIYLSTAKILIEQQEIPKDLVATTVTGYAAERITLIRNRVMTRDNLWAIAEQFDLYPQIRTLENQEEIVTRLREEVLLEMVSAEVLDPRSGRSVTATIAFTVSYQNESPEVAQKVTAKVAELYLDENRRSRTELAQQTSAFLNTEAERLREEISVLEAKLAEFKAKNASYLPESSDITTSSLDSALQQRAQLVARLGPLEARYGFLRSQLAVSGQSALLATARAELAAAREKYSEIHPDVVRLKRTVETLEAEARRGGGTSSAIASDPALMALQSESYEVAGNISATRAQMAELDRKIAEYQKRLAEFPEAEREYTALTRDLTHAAEKYRQIMDKLTGAQLAEELEREQKAERFTLVESASYPSAPSKPNRLAIIVLGFTFALAVGVGVAGLAEYLDRRILGPRELAAVFKAPPMAIIPDIPAVGTRR
jgi:polysaccharide chain length determinant protein (PEP-CTERM system associated)